MFSEGAADKDAGGCRFIVMCTLHEQGGNSWFEFARPTNPGGHRETAVSKKLLWMVCNVPQQRHSVSCSHPFL